MNQRFLSHSSIRPRMKKNKHIWIALFMFRWVVIYSLHEYSRTSRNVKPLEPHNAAAPTRADRLRSSQLAKSVEIHVWSYQQTWKKIPEARSEVSLRPQKICCPASCPANILQHRSRSGGICFFFPISSLPLSQQAPPRLSKKKSIWTDFGSSVGYMGLNFTSQPRLFRAAITNM